MRRLLLGSLILSGTLVAAGCGGGDTENPTVPTEDTGGGVDTSITPTDSGSPDTNVTDSGTPPDTFIADGGGGDVAVDAPAPGARGMPTNGSAVAITRDDKVAVAVNRTAGTVSVFNLALAGATPATRTANLAVGAEPWAAVIGQDGDTAYVILRKDQKVVKIDKLHTAPAIATASAKTGSEPTGIAINPTGSQLYVANWAEGTVTVVKTSDMTVASTIDLNGALATSGMLGTVAARPGLAHPRAVTITNNGDASDADETIYVTEFFSQAKTTGVPTDDSQFDLNRQGVVYRINAGTGAVGGLITIAPVADTTFVDSNGAKTGCFPNQLYAAALNADRLYVAAVCESPRGPTGPVTTGTPPVTNVANFKTQIHTAVFVVDTKTNTETVGQSQLLTAGFQKLYDSATPAIPDDATRRMPLIGNDIMFATGTNVAYLTSYGSDAVFRIAYKADGSLDRFGAPAANFINLKPGGTVGAGELPVGIAPTNAAASLSPFAVVINENSRNLSVLNLGTQITTHAVAAADPPAAGAATEETKGRKFFVTGLGRWSLRGQGWNSCESCHPDGLTDNVTWFFARGPRQTTSLDGSYDKKDPTKRRIFNWTGIFDETHDFELNTRGNSGGLGAIVWRVGTPTSADDRIIFDGTALAGAQKASAGNHAGLNGSTISLMPKTPPTPCADAAATCNNSVLKDWDEIDAYVKTIRPPRGATNLVATDVALGKTLFEANNCAACHGGSHWTISRVFYTPNDTNNGPSGLLRLTDYTRPTGAGGLGGFPGALNPPSNVAGGKAPFRLNPPDAANDQINCILRAVGTFPATLGATKSGITPAGVTVKEVRANMTADAQGATGFNPPSLVGMITGAPYFHAGNARTLEEAFSTTFETHYRAHQNLFTPTADQIRQLTAFILSIDADTAPIAVNTTVLGFNPDLCGQAAAAGIK